MHGCFKIFLHGAVKDVRNLFVNNPEYIHIPDIAPTAVDLVN